MVTYFISCLVQDQNVFFPRRLSLHRFGLESGGCKLLQLIVEVTFSAVVVIVIDGSVVFNGQVAEEGVSFS